ncbi:MAG: hypothetical protein HY690_10575 [Chloroflexi bacterium]|nr:hypothetical protein [Chloroflexota bacterium]
MAVVYSLTEAAALLGVSAATLSRRLPRERVRQGRVARLALEEILEVAPTVGVDPDIVRQRAEPDEELGPEVPQHIRYWARRAREVGIGRKMEAYAARIPEDMLSRHLGPPDATVELPEPWDGGFRPVSLADLEAMAAGEG